MANDSMRGGPRGSSDQAAFVGPTVMQFIVDSGGSTPGGTIFTKSAAADDGLLTNAHFGCDWQVIEVRLCVETAFVTEDCEIDIGTNADPDAIVDGGTTGSATSAARTEHVIALNGAAPTTTFGVTNGPLFLENVGTGSGAGKFSVSVLAKPVSGKYFDNS
jgi:hypothetical protein